MRKFFLLRKRIIMKMIEIQYLKEEAIWNFFLKIKTGFSKG